MPIDDLLNKLERAEQRFVGQEFLAPIVGANRVVVRIASVVCQLQVTAGLPDRFQGWAILRSLSTSRAAFVRAASLARVAAYLALFPAVRLILAQRDDATWLAFPAQQGDTRFRITGPVAVLLPEEGLERFDTVVARFDGRLFWYERRDAGRDPALAAYLREHLARRESDGLPPKPESLHKRGLSREEREAYAWVRGGLAQAARDRVEERLADALAHAGAGFQSHAERGDAYVVTYEVDGRQHVSTVRRDDLTVMTAGICLAGQDRRFDLTSLVGVLREAGRRGHLFRIGAEGMDEELYWEIHPPDEGRQ
jgi:hypothetical protein